ncbi:RNA polymerase sigma factor [Silvibacterium dinghuense]|uniref:RNA polymerase sigma factor n=1 Tax=Silvibacterium dinghuense TaxID=1560006 RepID=UPI0013E969D4|nr:sigma-70 family RNA polymerase sigma factor [Silvibacterium dinghuense]
MTANDLALRCAAGAKAEEWEEFVRRFTRPIARSVLRVARQWGENSSAVVDDIVQDVFLKFCEDDRRLLREFEPRFADSFLAYARVISAQVANDHFRRKNTQKRGDGRPEEELTEFHAPVFHAPVFSDVEWLDRSILLSEIDRALTANSRGTGNMHRTIFWLHYQQGMTANAIAALPGVSLSVKGVESALHRMLSYLRANMQTPSPARTANFHADEGISTHPAVQKSEWI